MYPSLLMPLDRTPFPSDVLTISSLHIGHTRAAEAAAFFMLCVPTLILDPISGLSSGKPPLTGGDDDTEPTDTVLSDGGDRGLRERGVVDGGARPFPLPRIRPPPSFLPDMLYASRGHQGNVGTGRKLRGGGDVGRRPSSYRDEDPASSSWLPRGHARRNADEKRPCARLS